MNSSTPVKKTRKNHCCAWCDRTIKVGESAVKWAGIWEGDFCHGYMHPECDAAFNNHPDVYDDLELGGFARGSHCEDGPPMFNPDGTRAEPSPEGNDDDCTNDRDPENAL